MTPCPFCNTEEWLKDVLDDGILKREKKPSNGLKKGERNMKLVLDEWIIREVIDTLYMARTTLLGITGLDSPQEVAKKSANETAITWRISKAIDIIQQSEQPEVGLEKEIASENKKWTCYEEIGFGALYDARPFDGRDIDRIARHFYELGKNSK